MPDIKQAKILILASNMGLWAEELQAPWDVLTEAGHELTLATFKGIKPLPLAFSMNTPILDLPPDQLTIYGRDNVSLVRPMEIEYTAW